MATYPGINAELVNTHWVEDPDKVGRPCNGIYEGVDATAVTRVSAFQNFTARYGHEPTTEEMLANLSLAAQQFEKLRELGVNVIKHTSVIVGDRETGMVDKYFLTLADRVTPAGRSPGSAETDGLFAGLAGYIRDGYENCSPLLQDVFKANQYIYGHTDADPVDKYWLVDVDPLIADPKNVTPDWAEILGHRVTTRERCDLMTYIHLRNLMQAIAPHGNRPFYEGVAHQLSFLPNTREQIVDYYYRRISFAGNTERSNLAKTLATIQGIKVA